MHHRRILYFAPDNPRPSGGVRTIYAHVGHLSRAGYPAFVVHRDPDFRPSWFDDHVPTLHYGHDGFTLRADDVAIIPEEQFLIFDALKAVPIRKIVFCQNHFYIPDGLREHRSWHDFGVERVFAGSEAVASFVQSVLGWQDVPVVHYAIDSDLFRPRQKELQIAYMPRRRPKEAHIIRSFWERLPGDEANVRWVPIDGASESTTAKVLGESAIFLALSELEGFGLPPVEAMACGGIVVGYHGCGGLEYATPENGYWCEDGNPAACLQALRRVVALVRDDHPEVQRVLGAAAQTAARYTVARREQDLLQFIGSVLGAS